MISFLLTSLFSLALGAPTSLVTKAKVENVSLAVVNKKTVTLRDIRVAYLMDQALVGSLSKEQAWDDALALSNFLVDEVVSLEAEQLRLYQMSTTEIASKMSMIKPELEALPEWKKWSVSDDELQQLLMRKWRAQSFLKMKAEPLGIDISEEEIYRYYEKNKKKLGGYSVDHFKDSIRAILVKSRSEAKLKEWFEVLKKKYQVRNLKRSA